MSMSRKFSPASVWDLCNNASTSASKLNLQFVGIFPTHCFVFAGIGLDFGAIDTDVPQLKYPQTLSVYQYLYKQRL